MPAQVSSILKQPSFILVIFCRLNSLYYADGGPLQHREIRHLSHPEEFAVAGNMAVLRSAVTYFCG